MASKPTGREVGQGWDMQARSRRNGQARGQSEQSHPEVGWGGDQVHRDSLWLEWVGQRMEWTILPRREAGQKWGTQVHSGGKGGTVVRASRPARTTEGCLGKGAAVYVPPLTYNSVMALSLPGYLGFFLKHSWLWYSVLQPLLGAFAQPVAVLSPSMFCKPHISAPSQGCISQLASTSPFFSFSQFFPFSYQLHQDLS